MSTIVKREYPIKSASTFVGNHYLLSERQRLVLARAVNEKEWVIYMIKEIRKLKALWIFMAVLFGVHAIFFASGIFEIVLAFLYYLLLPVITIAMAWGSYIVGKCIQTEYRMNPFLKFIFSLTVAMISSASYWICNDIYNSITEGHFTAYHTIEYLSAPLQGNFPLSGSELNYFFFVIVFVFILLGFAIQTYREKTSG